MCGFRHYSRSDNCSDEDTPSPPAPATPVRRQPRPPASRGPGGPTPSPTVVGAASKGYRCAQEVDEVDTGSARRSRRQGMEHVCMHCACSMLLTMLGYVAIEACVW